MPNATYFVQECPTCGRRLQIRVEYLGRGVVCQHCQGKLVAMDPCGAQGGSVDHGSALLHRADELLKSVAQRNSHLRASPP
jgi:DNA-directed RNA polymerase subunit RPC12/RpoP